MGERRAALLSLALEKGENLPISTLNGDQGAGIQNEAHAAPGFRSRGAPPS
jgi:hypothetical protein